jgi:hypothetical protein
MADPKHAAETGLAAVAVITQRTRERLEGPKAAIPLSGKKAKKWTLKPLILKPGRRAR